MDQNFRFIRTNNLRKTFDLGKFAEAKLREKLPSPLYWIQPDRNVLWNWRLVHDYLINGPGPDHDRLVEQYLSTLDNTAA